MANVGRLPDERSRWGFELGAQTGVDSEGLVTAPPPPAYEPIANADTWRHLYRANASYLVDAGRGLKVHGWPHQQLHRLRIVPRRRQPELHPGLPHGHGPLFPHRRRGSLERERRGEPRVLPELRLQLSDEPQRRGQSRDSRWRGRSRPGRPSRRTSTTGPTRRRPRSSTGASSRTGVVEWDNGPFGLAGAFDYGTEKQARLPGQPRHQWMAGAAWVRWDPAERFSLAFRPEFYWDPDGQITQASQLIHAYTGTLKIRLSARSTPVRRFDRGPIRPLDWRRGRLLPRAERHARAGPVHGSARPHVVVRSLEPGVCDPLVSFRRRLVPLVD